MKNFKKLILKIDNTIQDAVKNLDESGKKIVLVTKNNKFIGTITDGDIRRGILQGISLKTSVQKILNKNAIVCDALVSIKELNNIMISNDINSIPIIDKNKI